jgi:uncharacterized membrane protein
METGICFLLLLVFIVLMVGGVAFLRLIFNALSGSSTPPVPLRAEPDPRQAQEILQLRNHIARLEHRVTTLEANIDLQKMRAKPAEHVKPAEPVEPADAVTLDDDFDINSLLASKSQQPLPIPSTPPASPSSKPSHATTPAPKHLQPNQTHFRNIQTPPVKSQPADPTPATPPKPAAPVAPAPIPTVMPSAPARPTPSVTPAAAAPVAAQASPSAQQATPPTPTPTVPPVIPTPQATPPAPATIIAPITPTSTPPAPQTTPGVAPIPTVMKGGPTPAAASATTPTPQPPPIPQPVAQPAPATPSAPAASIPPTPPAKPVSAPAPAPVAPQPKRDPITLESLLTMRLFVWIAGIVLSLAGILLMKYLNDRSVFPEWTRLVLGAVIGFAALGAGEYFRKLYQRIAATIVGAGLTTLFAVVLAGTLNNPLIASPFIPKPVAFALLAVIALGAVGLSLRHGMLVAVLGLLGGYVTPAILSTGEPKPVALALYLMFLQTGLVLVIKKRGWMPLAALTLLATMCWAAAMVFMGQIGAGGLPIALLLISTGVQFALVLDRSNSLPESAPESIQDPNHWVFRIMGLIAVAMGLFLLSTRVILGDFQVMDWGYLGLVSLALILLGRLKQGYSLLPYFGLVATAFLFFQWMRQPLPADIAVSATQTAPSLILAGLSATFILGGMLAAINGPHPARFAGLSSLAAVLFAAIAYWFEVKLNLQDLMPWVAIAGTGAFTIAAGFTHALVPPSRNKTLVLAIYLVAASAFALAIAPLWFENWIAPAWAAQVLIMALIARHFKIPILHGLAMPIALLVFARLTLAPDLLTKDHAQLGLSIWILTNYLPVSLFLAGAAWIIATDASTPATPPSDQDTLPLFNLQDNWLSLAANALVSLAQILLGVMFTFLLRAAFVPESPNLWASAFPTTTQWALWSSVWMGMCLVATLLGTHIAWAKNNWLPVLWMLAGAVGCFLLTTFLNPALSLNSTLNVGDTPVFNLLLALYGLPCLAAAACAWGLYKHGHKGLHNIAVTLSAVMGILLIMLQVRHGFVGSPIHGPDVTLMQSGAYTLAGLLAAIAVRQTGRALAWEPAINIAAGYLFLTGILFACFQCTAVNPLFHAATSITPLNLVLAYALPALILLACADLLSPLTATLRLIGAVLTALAAALLIRHAFHPEKFNELKFLLTEAGTYTITGLVLAAALRQLAQRFEWPRFDAITWFYIVTTAAGAAIFQGLICNPIVSDHQVSTRIFFNAILYAYGLPSLLAIAGSQFMPPAQRFVRGAGLTGLFVTALLMVRHAFHPGNMTEPGVMMVEAAAYTITVKIVGILAMEWGIRKDDKDTATIAQAFLNFSLVMAVLGQIIFKNPLVSHESVGALPIVNGLLALYLIPAGLLAVQAWQCERRGSLIRAKVNAVAALVMAVLFLSFESRWFFHDAGVLTLFRNGQLQLSFLESSTYAPLWLLLGAALSYLGMKKAKPVLVQSGFGVQAFAVGWIFFALVLLFNPILSENSVGALYIINGITAGFLLPAAILIASSAIYQRERRALLTNITVWTGHALLFIGYSLTIRHFFHGEFLSAQGMLVAERYAYSAGWVLLAVAFLVVGILTGKHRPRYASLAIMIIGVIKVGYDIFLLQDLYRIASLAGLGIGLLAMTFIYQKYVFKAQEEEEEVA